MSVGGGVVRGIENFPSLFLILFRIDTRGKSKLDRESETEAVLLDGWFCSLLALAVALFVTGNVMIHLAAKAPDWVLENQSFVHTNLNVPYKPPPPAVM